MVTVAIIGCGRIANFAHLPALSKMEDVRIKYACDLLIEKANAVVEKYGAENVYFFTYDWRKTPEQLATELNEYIETAKANGAIALFGEKYGKVAVKIVPWFSPRLQGEVYCYPHLPYKEMCPLFAVDEKLGAMLLKYVEIHDNPDPDKKMERIVLKGDIPSPANPPSGCRFRTRCRFATEACAQGASTVEVEPGHFVTCRLMTQKTQ